MNGTGKWAARGFGGLGAVLIVGVACAGGDTPPRTQELVDNVARVYEDDAVGAAGSVNMVTGGSGGMSGGSGSGGGSSGGSAGAAGAGDGGSSGSAGSSGGGDVCDAPGMILTPKCGSAGCHGMGSFVGDFGASAAAAQALVDKGANCDSTLKYFDSANPDGSLVVTKLEDRPPCGSPMPLGGDPLSQTEVDCIIDWVSQF